MTPAGRRAAPLGESVIVDAGMAILRGEGMEAVTMRRVAAALGAAPASLYVHISGREELQLAMLERVTGTVALAPPDPARWREQVHALMGALRDAFAAHPGLAAVAVAAGASDERTLAVVENLLALLRAGGVRDQEAAWGASILPLFTMASTAAAAFEGESDPAGGDAFDVLAPERFPNITALGRELDAGSGAERFRFAVDVFLDGLLARSRP